MDECVLEDEAHVLFACSCYSAARHEFIQMLSAGLKAKLSSTSSVHDRCQLLLSSEYPDDWVALGRFLARVRQVRRRRKRQFETLQARFERTSYAVRKAAWIARGRHVCRHGMFFNRKPCHGCQCLAQCWDHVSWMPKLDTELKALVIVPFQAHEIQRLGQIQAELRRREW
eukprot:9499557-Karenia_brevis.AAC.1